MGLRDMLTLARQAVAREIEITADRVDAWVDTWAPPKEPEPAPAAPAPPIAEPAPVVATPTPIAETCWDCDKPPAAGFVLCQGCTDAAAARYVQMHKTAPKKRCAKRRPK